MPDPESELERLADEGTISYLSFAIDYLDTFGPSQGGAATRAVRGILGRVAAVACRGRTPARA